MCALGRGTFINSKNRFDMKGDMDDVVYLNGRFEVDLLERYAPSEILVRVRMGDGSFGAESLSSLRDRLYGLVSENVRRFRGHYYRQYVGDWQDLVHEYYLLFLRPKCRGEKRDSEGRLLSTGGGQLRTLIDRYAEGCHVSFEKYVRGCVCRKLQDSSRCDTRARVSLDEASEFGDGFLYRSGLVSSMEGFDLAEVVLVSDGASEVDVVREGVRRLSGLSTSCVRRLVREYGARRGVLPEGMRVLFDAMFRGVSSGVSGAECVGGAPLVRERDEELRRGGILSGYSVEF